MYSGKPPSISYTNGGTVGESGPFFSKDASAAVGLKQQLTTSENCDPNLWFDREAPRKAGSSPNSEESRTSAGNGSISLLPKPATGVARSVCEAGAGESERQLKEVNPPVKSVPSPTKVSASPHQHGHGHRQHICRSPRCASNNPDYATPAQPTPRKYLISKRHLLPGAICTRDPASLANQGQESLTPQAPSTGKPPKPIRTLENAFRQPSFLNVSNANNPPLADAFPPSRIPKPPSAPSPTLHETTRLDQIRASFIPQTTSPAEPSLSSHRAPLGQCTSDESSCDRLVTPVERDGDRTEHLIRLDSDMSCTVLGASSASSRASDAGERFESSVETSPLEFPATPAVKQSESELTSLEELFSPTFAELPESRASDQSFSELENSSFAAPPSVVRSCAELEYVTEKLAQNLAFEKVEDSAAPEAECNPGEGVSSADVATSQVEVEANAQQGEGLSSADVPTTAQTEIEEALGASSEQEDEQVSNPNAGSHFGEGHEDGDGYRFRGGLSVGDTAQTLEETEEQWSKSGSQCAEGLEDAENYQFRGELPARYNAQHALEETAEQEKPHRPSIASFIANFESARSEEPEVQRGVPKFVRGKGRQLWRSDCRDSREVVFLKPTSPRDRRAGDWMVDNILEGAISKLNPSGKGRVRVLVEAFESLMNLGDTDMPERRASRVWCLNRMERGEVDEDGEEFEDGDQRVDCYEVSGDGLQLRASMRLSLGGGNRHAFCSPDDASEIEMSAIQKVQDWDDCRQSANAPNFEGFSEDLNRGCARSQSSLEGAVVDDQDCRREDESKDTELTIGEHQRRMSTVRFSERHVLSENDRFSEDLSCEERTTRQFECYNTGDAKQRIEELDLQYKFKASRRRRFWKACSVKAELDVPCSSSSGSAEKDQRVVRGTMLEPFHLLTEERGAVKEYQFAKKLEEMFAEEERLRNPIAQGLPWTTDEPEVVPKPPVKEQTRPVEFRHYSNSRAIERAEFDNYLAKRGTYVQMQRQEEERLRQLIEEEEVKRLRKEMVPRAQLMPFFDQPFMPTRSSKRLTVPKEPAFRSRQHKRPKCIVWQEQQHL